ncbi:MAG: electron transfer flavoprotein subunit alpha/FixB family protein, partial [Duodenibacillus sp.]|nr:electron transfer flavoprotein subunit alpha/FixB family protein [Duodenibacillus sp.]
MTILVVAEHDNASLKLSTLSAVAAAQKIGGAVDVLVAGLNARAAAEAASRIAGVARVISLEGPAYERQLPEALGEAVAELVRRNGYGHALFVAGTSGKAAAPRAAALLGAAAVSEITGVVAPDTFRRFIYAGGVLATVRAKGPCVVATVRPTAFEPAAGEGGAAEITAVDIAPAARAFEFVSLAEVKSDRPDLLTAKRVVAGGRGLIDEAGFAALERLADKLGAALGSTRAAVDLSLAPNETQVGQTGKIVAPELYFAFGISGAIQHVAGMKDSKVIVAVNKDPEAPIFQMCDQTL